MVRRAASQVTIVDVFSGAGGLSLGWLSALGNNARLALAVDSDESLAGLYRANFPSTQFVTHRFSPTEVGDGDRLATQTGLTRGDVDVLLAGPPCQAFSSAGKRSASLDNRLALRVCELARLLRPKVIVIENVPEFAWSQRGLLIGRVRVQLGEAGYYSETAVLNASAYGVPQVRSRCFIIGVTVEAYRGRTNGDIGSLVPTPTHEISARGVRRMRTADDSATPPTVAEAVGDLPPLNAGEGAEESAYDRAPWTEYQRRMRADSPVLFNHVAVAHGPSIVNALAQLEPGETPQRTDGHPLRRKEYFRSAYARLSPDDVAPTMTTQTHNPGSGRFTHYRDNRVLTVREVARLQGFPDSFRFVGTSEVQRRHVGNAVPPILSRALAAGLIPYVTAK
jgi:DNA (cytosine-5)-methyltransferase 1